MARPKAIEGENPVQLGQVLIYLDRKGGWKQLYYVKAPQGSSLGAIPGALEPRSARCSPGLGLIQAEAWPYVSEQARFKARRDKQQIVVVAGERESLAEGWGSARTSDVFSWLEKTSDPKVLEVLRDLEAQASRPRVEVSQAIDDAAERVRVQMARMRDQRSEQRRRHRSATW